MTNDGGRYSEAGFVFLGSNGKITPIAPHYLQVGRFYETIANKCGFSLLSGNGKMMGLSSYGATNLHGILPIGNLHDWRDWYIKRGNSADSMPNIKELCDAMLAEVLSKAHNMGYDVLPFGSISEVTSRITTDVSSAVQHLVENCLVFAAQQVKRGMEEAGHPVSNLCLSGGVALNCPANTRISNSSGFQNVHIEPHCDDSGLSIGAAQFVYYSLLEYPYKVGSRKTSEYAMIGIDHSREINLALQEYLGDIHITECENLHETIANDLVQDKVVAIFQSKSELGPRALGNRSILANPMYAHNWERVNSIKGREKWRPFAPIVLEEKTNEWFLGGPQFSPFMLFAYKVRPECHAIIPAVTHVDGTSRIQTISIEDGLIWRVVSSFEYLSGIPVIMNTSFNGPEEPIVEHPRDAILLLLTTEIDSLYICGAENLKVIKKHLIQSEVSRML